MVVTRVLKGGAKVSLSKPEAGAVPYVIATAKADVWNRAVEGIDVRQDPKAPAKSLLATTLNTPRVGIYQSYDPSMDEGWTRWVLDRYQFEYTALHNEDIKPGKLRQRFDAIILPDQRSSAILAGLDYKTIVEQYRGGLGEAGRDAVRAVVTDG